MFASQSQRVPRRGLAPLEFVMVLPFLLLFAAVIIRLGDGWILKFYANIDARREANLAETGAGNEPPPLPNLADIKRGLAPMEEGTHGLMEADSDSRLSLRPVLRSEADVRGWHTELKGSWDHKTVEFAQRADTDPFDSRAFRMAGSGFAPPANFFGDLNPDFLSGFLGGDLNPLSLVSKLAGPLQSLDQLVAPIRQSISTLRNTLSTVEKAMNAIKPVKAAFDLLDEFTGVLDKWKKDFVKKLTSELGLGEIDGSALSALKALVKVDGLLEMPQTLQGLNAQYPIQSGDTMAIPQKLFKFAEKADDLTNATDPTDMVSAVNSALDLVEAVLSVPGELGDLLDALDLNSEILRDDF